MITTDVSIYRHQGVWSSCVICVTVPRMVYPSHNEHWHGRGKKRNPVLTVQFCSSIPWGTQKIFCTDIKIIIFSQSKKHLSYTQRIETIQHNYVFNKLLYFVKKCFFLSWECFSLASFNMLDHVSHYNSSVSHKEPIQKEY